MRASSSLVGPGLARVSRAALAIAFGLALAHCGDDVVAPVELVDTGADAIADAVTETATDASSDTSAADSGAPADDADAEGDAPEDETGDAADETGDAADAADAGCGALGASDKDVWVDGATTKPSVGTAACPFKTIREATDLGAVSGRTIHVKAGNYAETGALKVKDGVKLLGEGVGSTKVTAAGACAEATCAVEVAAGGALEAIAVTSSGHGVVTADGTAPAILKNVLVTDAQDGIVVLGGAEIGPSVQVNKNEKNGLRAKGSKTVKITGSGNEANENDENGILAEGSARIELSGATTASNNKGHGVHLKSTTPTTTAGQHVITGLTAKLNGMTSAGTFVAASSGVHVEATSSLKLRDSVLLQNGQNGLTVIFGTNALDVGTTGDGGGNTFSVSTTTNRNRRAAMCLENTGGTGTQPANGNKWAACALIGQPVNQTAITGNCASLGTQEEIAYKKKSGGGDNPVSISGLGGCSVGS